MIKKLITILGCVCTLNTYAQINMKDSTVNVVAYWEKGEQHAYKYTNQKMTIKDNDTSYNHYITYDIIVTILKANKNSYALKWEYKNGVNTDYNFPIPLKQELNNNQTFYYQTNEMGVFKQVDHWKKIKKHNKKFIQKEFGHYKNLDANAQNIYNNYKKVLLNQKQFELTQLQDIQIYHNPFGIKLKLGEVETVTYEETNILDKDKPLKMLYEVSLDEIDTANHYYMINTKHEIDPEDLKRFITEFALKYADQEAEENKKLVSNLNKKIEIQNIIHDTGWLLHAYNKTEINIGDTHTIEEKTIQLVTSDESEDEVIIESK